MFYTAVLGPAVLRIRQTRHDLQSKESCDEPGQSVNGCQRLDGWHFLLKQVVHSMVAAYLNFQVRLMAYCFCQQGAFSVGVHGFAVPKYRIPSTSVANLEHNTYDVSGVHDCGGSIVSGTNNHGEKPISRTTVVPQQFEFHTRSLLVGLAVIARNFCVLAHHLLPSHDLFSAAVSKMRGVY